LAGCHEGEAVDAVPCRLPDTHQQQEGSTKL
jgi:hypothetical protein